MMNERVKELAEQATTEHTSYYDGRGNVTETIFDKDKFAELIVKECLAHGKLTQSQAVVNGSEEYNAGREMGIEVFMNQIKLHFGVEE
jgi:hypothetical protein